MSKVQPSVRNSRSAARQDVIVSVLGQHSALGEVPMTIMNLSTTGFLAEFSSVLTRGDRVLISLPIIGRIEALLVWTDSRRAGFQFERILRPDDFARLLECVKPKRKSVRTAANEP